MRDTFIKVPFAVGGDKTPIPNSTQPDGSISMQQGWGVDYEKEVGVDPAAKSVDRQDMNQILNLATSLLNRWQTETFPEWIDSAANGGSPFSYPIGSVVRYSPDGIEPYLAWINLTANNTTSPSVPNGWILFTSALSLAQDPTESQRGAPLLASQAQAEAGSNNTAMMTALRVMQYVSKWWDTNYPGAEQTWIDVLSSRVINTAYRNTTGKEIFISINGNGSSNPVVQCSQDGTTWISVGILGGSGDGEGVFIPVAKNSYYRVNGTGSISQWVERR